MNGSWEPKRLKLTPIARNLGTIVTKVIQKTYILD